MTAGVSFGSGRAAAAVPTREELRRQLLALVLAFVLVWYTVVVPAHGSAPRPSRPTPGDEGLDGEVRGVGGPAPRGVSNPRPDEDLDWPEFIYP